MTTKLPPYVRTAGRGRPRVPADQKLIGRGVCLTAAEWQFISDAAAANGWSPAVTIRACVRVAKTACYRNGYGVLLPRDGGA
jgi:hypothetical protein